MQNVHLTISSYWCFMPLSKKIQLYPGGRDILCLLRFLLHHPDCCRVMYCYSIITSPRLLSCDVLLFCVSFSLLLLFLLHHPNCCRVMYCYSTFLFHYYYYITPGDVLLFYVSFSLLLLFLLHHPNCCRVMYCYSTFLFHYYYYSYYITPTVVG